MTPNLGYTRFLFVRGCRDDDATRLKLKAAGDGVARGFLNAFEREGATSDAPALETVQFLSLNGVGVDATPLHPARYALQVNSRYRPRLDELEKELRRRVGEAGAVDIIEGCLRVPQYSRASVATWWAMTELERHQYFYPHHDRASQRCVPGHAAVGRDAAPHIYRRLYHNPHGPGRPGEWDFVTYFECDDDNMALFDATLDAMRDVSKNPEWRYVEEGPMWRGRRVLRW